MRTSEIIVNMVLCTHPYKVYLRMRTSEVIVNMVQ